MKEYTNLKPFAKGEERARECARRAGRASARARAEARANGIDDVGAWRREKSFAKAAKMIGELKAPGKYGKMGMTFAAACVLRMFKQAQRGSVRAFHLLTLLLGEVGPNALTVDFSRLPHLVDDIAPKGKARRAPGARHPAG